MIVMVDQLAHLLDEGKNNYRLDQYRALKNSCIVPAGRFARSLFQMIKVSQARLRAKQSATPTSGVDSLPQPTSEYGEQPQPPRHEYTNDFAHLIHPSLGVYEFSGGVASDITHGLLSTDGDWPEWIQNSVSGCFDSVRGS
jgi:hypothetical protein